MQAFKLTGFTRLYGELNVTGKNAFDVHNEALKRLKDLGHHVSKMKDIETQAGIKPPEKKSTPVKPKTPKTPKEPNPTVPKEEKQEKKKKTKKEESAGVWDI